MSSAEPLSPAEPASPARPKLIDLTGPGPGQDLVAHLDGALAGIARSTLVSQAHPEDAAALLALLDAQARSRWLDVAARRLQAAGRGWYTIGSSGHESNAAVALAVAPTDPAFLHYRSGAFYLARAARAGHPDAVHDVARGLVASAEEPIAGGPHKVFGHADLAIVPMTSTIASHLPRALGTAWAIASFGDASANHSTAQGAVNAACWAAHQGSRMPLLLLCEDNGLGISVRTPTKWIEEAFAHRPGLQYLAADGDDPLAVLAAAGSAVAVARGEQRPVLLHLRTVRLGGHAGADAEVAYRNADEIAADLLRDPLAATMRALVEAAVLTGAQVAGRLAAAREEVDAAVLDVALGDPPLTSAADVVAPLAPRDAAAVAARAKTWAAPEAIRRAVVGGGRAGLSAGGGRLPEEEGPLTLAESINRTLLDAGAADPRLIVLGEDVGRKGGVYGVTRRLRRRLGASQVVDTLLDEQTVLGLALGAGLSGLLPVPEIQYLAYLHNAADQLRGEAATMQFFSQGAYRNPMVVRVPGLAYQKGFGGHFHNDNSFGALRDIPGLVIACPAHPGDAPALLRTCLAAADVDGAVCVVLEPIALYHERDLLTDGDGVWTAAYLPPDRWDLTHAPIGLASTWGSGEDLTIATYGNGLRMSLRAAERLRADGAGVRVVDLRWLAPLPVDDVLREARATGRLLVVDEARHTGGGIAEALLTAVRENGFSGRAARVTSQDCFIPLGPAARLVLLSQDDVERAARELLS